jgi:hypothetical protein
MIAPTQRHVPLFVERNLFLAAVLGCLSGGRRLERWIEAEAAQGAPTPGARLPADSVFLSFLLGVVSFQRTANRVVGELTSEGDLHTSSRAPKEAPCLRSLMK